MTLLKPAEIEALRHVRRLTTARATRLWRWLTKVRDPIVLGTMLTAIGTIFLGFVALQQTRLARAQIDEMAAEQRPWVFAEMTDYKPLVADAGNGNVLFTFTTRLSNTGHLPAGHVFISAKVKVNAYFDQQDSDRRDVCRGIANIGVSVFPGQTLSSYRFVAMLYKTDAESYAARFGGKTIVPVLYMCVAYYDPAGGVHFTPYVYLIGKLSENVPGVFAIPRDVEKMKKLDLGLELESIGLGGAS